ncbi:nitroreductase [Roseburia hominis]
MTVREALNNRFSCRKFSSQPVTKDMLEDIFKDAFRTPSCENSQPWEVYVAGTEAMERLRAEYEKSRKAKIPADLSNRFNGRWTEEMAPRIDEYFDGIVEHEAKGNFDYTMQKRNLFYAPVMIFLCIDKELPDWSLFDTGMFAQSLMLSASEHGLATMASAVSVSYPEAVRSVLNIPENKSIVIGVGIGYPDKEAPINDFRTTRKETGEIHYIL